MKLPKNNAEGELSWAEDNSLKILWNDGHESQYSIAYLRRICPCAFCQGQPKNDEGLLRMLPLLNPGLLEVHGVGNYAISFTFTDGHSYGIYPYRYLKEMCPCVTCRGKRKGISLGE